MKKVLSLVLSLCLIVSLGAGITAEAAATDLYYDFTVAAQNISGVSHTYIPTLTYDVVNSLDTANKSDEWAYFNITDGSSGNDYVTYLENNGPIVVNAYTTKNKSHHLRLQFKVPNAGKYVPMINLASHKNNRLGAIVPYSLYEVNADGTLGALILTKYIHTNSAQDNNHYIALSDTAIELAAGTYVVSFGNEQTKGQSRTNGLKLVAADSAVATKINLGLGEGYYEVNAGQKIEIPISVTLSTGSKLDLATAKGWNSTPDTASVHTRLNKENGTLDITGLAENTTAETFEYKLGDAMVRFNVKVNAADYVAADKDLNYNFFSATGADSSMNGGSNLLNGSVVTSYALSNYGKAYGAAYSLKESEPWKITSKKKTDGSDYPSMYFNAFMANANYGIYFYNAGTAEMGILVANDGMYTPSLTLGNAAPACDFTVTIKDMNDTTLVTKTVAANTAANSTVSLADAAVEMKAGEYKLIFSKTAENKMAYINGFKLAYAGGLEYNVTLEAGAGELAAELPTYTHGYAETLPAVTAPEGYTFDGWYETADFSGAAVTSIDAMARGDKTFYAKYTYIPQTYNVTLNANGGTVASDVTSYTEGTAVTLPTATKAGYVFAGWYDNADLIGTAVTEIAADATGDKAFYAKWTLDVSADDFDVTASSGYYAYYVSNPYREGVIAISAAFAKFDTLNVTKAGIMIYVAGNEANEAKIARVESDEVAAAEFSAIFNGIAKENFDKEVLAKAYVVVDGEYIYSDAITTSVDSTRWVGVKPE